jgi:hypothetical protein
MELVGTAINAAVVAAAALILGWLGKGRFDAVDQRIDRLEDRLDRGMDAMRSDLTQVALAVGVRPRATKD